MMFQNYQNMQLDAIYYIHCTPFEKQEILRTNLGGILGAGSMISGTKVTKQEKNIQLDCLNSVGLF